MYTESLSTYLCWIKQTHKKRSLQTHVHSHEHFLLNQQYSIKLMQSLELLLEKKKRKFLGRSGGMQENVESRD